MSAESNLALLWFCFTTLCDWLKKLFPPLLNQSDQCKTKTNSNLVTCVFRHFGLVMSVYFEFSLAHSDIYLCSDWLLYLTGFWFYGTQPKNALNSDILK